MSGPDCEHYACRCARAEELMQMADFYGSARLAWRAVQAHESRVPCRQPPEGFFRGEQKAKDDR